MQSSQLDDVLGGWLVVRREALVVPDAPIGHRERLTRDGYV